MAGGRGNPYRPPCGGWSESGDLYIGGCEQHFRRSESVYVAAVNVTATGQGYTWAEIQIDPPNPANPDYGQRAEARAIIQNGTVASIEVTVPGWGYSTPPNVTINGDGNGAAAVAVLAGPKLLLNDLCDFPPVSCPDAQFISRDTDMVEPGDCTGIYNDGNCFHEKDLWIDLSHCAKRGFKAWGFAKTWHGRLGFLQPIHDDAVITQKYQTVMRQIQNEGAEYHEIEGTPVIDRQWQANCSNSTLVHQHSGKIEETSHSWNVNAPQGGGKLDWSTQLPGYTFTDGLGSWVNVRVGSGIIELQSTPQGQRFVGTPQELEYHLVNDLGWTEASVSLSDNLLIIQASFNLEEQSETTYHSWTETLLIRVELGSPITVGEIASFIFYDPSGWSLVDDIEHPWRLDGNCHLIPWMQWDEYEHYSDPDIGLGTDPYEPPYPGPTGEAIGKPIDTADDQTGQRWFPYKMFQFRNAAGQMMGQERGWAPVEDGLPTAASFWKDGPPTVNQFTWGTSCGWIAWDPYNHRFWVQIYAEVFSPVPSHNFARPCGPDRFRIDTRDSSYAEVYGPGVTYCDSVDDPQTYPPLYVFRDGNNNPTAWPICGRIMVEAVEPIDATHTRLILGEADPPHSLQDGDVVEVVNIPGLNGQHTITMDGGNIIIEASYSGQYTGGGWIKSPGAPEWKWNDDQRKGDYVVRKWRYRQVGETWVNELDVCETHCVEWSPCCPTIIVAAPVALTQPWPKCVAAVHAVDSIPPTYLLYASEAKVAISLRHPDPLWTPPPEDVLCVDGQRIYIGGYPPMVEERCELPQGAPPLPEGFIYGGPDDLWHDPPPPTGCWHGPVW